MKKGTKTFLIILGVVILASIPVISYWVNTSNTEIDIRNTIPAQTDNVDLFYTKMWETLSTKAGVTKEYAKDATAFQVAVMEGRYSTGEKMMMWIQESNPTFDQSLYKDLMNSIEGLREGFFVEQQKLRQLKLEHDNLITKFPSKIIVGKRGQIEVQLLVNQATKNARETGIDESPTLF